MSNTTDRQQKKRIRLSPVDTAWLRMDTTDNLMIVNFVIEFKDKLSIKQFKEIVTQRFLKHDRFNRKVVKTFQGYYLEKVKHIDLDHHVKEADIKQPTNKVALQEFAGELFSEPLNTNYPLWEFHYVSFYNKGSAVIGRIHHCYADGVALMTLLSSLVDEAESVKDGIIVRTHRRKAVFKDLLNNRITGLAKELYTYPRDLIKVATLAKDENHPLKSSLTGKKKVAWIDSISISEVKTVSKKMESSVNEVLISCVARMLQLYLEQEGKTDKLNSIRAAIPVNIRSSNKGLELGNQFGLVYLDLPLNQTESKDTLEITHRMMTHLKDTKQPLVSFLSLGAFGLVPEKLQKLAVNFFSGKASMVLTYVPGPRTGVSFSGKRIDQIITWVPQTGDMGIGISVVSYNDRVSLGIVVDEALIDNPTKLVKLYKPVFQQLKNEVLGTPQYNDTTVQRTTIDFEDPRDKTLPQTARRVLNPTDDISVERQI